MDTPVLPVALVGIGGYLLWFAIHYWARGGWPTAPVKSVLTGQGIPAPAQASSTTLTADIQAEESAADSWSSAADSGAGKAAGGGAGPAATASTIANDAIKYVGAGYIFGGNADKTGNWDCSSFVSYVLGHDLGLPLPGGHWGDPGFPPHSHGPTTVQYLLYGSPVSQSQVQAGDLIISSVHMGIAVSATEMVSAQDPQLGTGYGNFPQGFPGGPPVYRRVSSSGSAIIAPNGQDINQANPPIPVLG